MIIRRSKTLKALIVSLTLALVINIAFPLEVARLISDKLFAEASMIVGESGAITPGSPDTARSGIAASAYNHPTFRVSIFRNRRALLVETAGLEAIYNNMRFGFPERLTGSIFFMHSTPFDFVSNRRSPLSIGHANTSNKTLTYTSSTDAISNIIRKSGTRPANGVYFQTIQSMGVNAFRNNWRTRATRVAESRGAWSYIFTQSGGEFTVNERINRVFNPGNIDFNNVRGWTQAQSEEAFMRYLDKLLTLYTLSQNTTRQVWGQAIDDFLNSNNLQESPITIVIDTAALMTFDGGAFYILIPSIDFLEYTAGVESAFATSGAAWWTGNHRTLRGSDAYEQIRLSTQLSIDASPTFRRITDRFDRNNGFSFGASAFTRGVQRTSNRNSRWTDGNLDTALVDYFNILRLTPPSDINNGRYGYMLSPAPVRLPNLTFGALRAEPDNRLIQTNTLGVPVNLTVNSGVTSRDFGAWESVINSARAQRLNFQVRITFTRTSDEVSSPLMINPNPATLTWTPTEMLDFIQGRRNFTTIDDISNVPTAGRQRIVFNYTANINIRMGNREWNGTGRDSASFRILGPRIGFTSRPEAFSELKNFGAGSNLTGTLNESFEAMAGVPSTEQLYFAAGGSEFIVDITLEHVRDEVAKRSYESIFTGTDCQFRAGDTAGTFTFPSPGGGGSGNTTLNAHEGGTFSVTWTGSIPNNATAVTALHNATSTAIPDRTAYNAARAAAQAYVNAVNSTVFSHTAASDGITRNRSNWGATISLDAPIDPVTTHASVPCTFVAPSGTPPSGGVPCSQEMATAQPGAAGSFTITVSWTVPAHVICGPCCSHVLPAIHDTWAQTWTFDTMRIVGVHVWRIDQAAVNGLEEITSINVVGADIVQGRPNIFYNIALKNNPNYLNQTNRGGATRSSTVGRVRYSLDPQQHDEVTYNNGVRSNRCDGLAQTFPANVTPGGGNGHAHAWSTGFIYNAFRPPSSTSGATRFAGQRDFPTNVVDFLVNNTNTKDKATPEYTTLLNQRRAQVTPTMITDFLILQTSSGDQSVMYFHRSAPTSARAEAQLPRLQVTEQEMWNNNINSASRWADDHINIGSYNGRFDTPNSKFTWTNRGNAAITFLDPDPAGTILRPARPNRNLMLYRGALNIILENTNQSYTTGDAEVFWANHLHWVDRTSQRFLGITNPHTVAPLSTNVNIGGITGFNFGPNASGIPQGSPIGGFTLPAPYSREHTKINDIIIHNPVSTMNTSLVSLPQSRDQRTGTILGGAVSVLDTINNSLVCPLDPALCDFRVLDCTFHQDTLLADFDFDTRDAVGNPINRVTGNSLILPSGFSVVNTASLNGLALRAQGTRLAIPFSELNLQYHSSTRLRVEADIVMNQLTTGSMIFSFHGYNFFVPANQRLGTLNTGNGWERRANTNVATGSRVHLAIEFNFNSVDRSRVFINGNEVTYTRINQSSPITSQLVGDSLFIGSWGANNNYPANFHMDNLRITRLAGTHEHTEDCFRFIMTHPNGLNRHVHSRECLESGANWLINEFTNNRLTDAQIRNILGDAYEPVIANSFGPVIHTWNNWTTANMRGFFPIHHASLSANGGNLIQTSSGNDPHIGVNVDFAALGVQKIEVTLDNTTSSTLAELFWSRNNAAGFSGARVVRATMLPNTNNQVIRFVVRGHAEWRDTIDQLRFDLGETAGEVRIRQINVHGPGNLASAGAAQAVVWESGTVGQHTFNAVPGQYILEVWGAQGGNSSNGGGGRGAYAVSTMTISESTNITILVGEQGGSGNMGSSWSGAGGGGGTFIATSNNIPIVVAGGGGGASGSAGNHALGTIGNGNGATGGVSGAGGGFNTNGSNPSTGWGRGGNSFINGGARQTGGISSGNPYGGLGGGGSTHGHSGGGGGGGGYSGGNGASSDNQPGNGGSSYFTGVNSAGIGGNATMPNPSGGTMVGRQGNGFARITSTFAPVRITHGLQVSTNQFTPTLINGLSYNLNQFSHTVGTVQQQHVGTTWIITTINGNSENNTTSVPRPPADFTIVGAATNGRAWYKRRITQADVGRVIQISGGDHWGYVAFFIPDGWDLDRVISSAGDSISTVTNTDTVIMSNLPSTHNALNGHTLWNSSFGSSLIHMRSFTGGGTSFAVPRSLVGWHATTTNPHAIFTRTLIQTQPTQPDIFMSASTILDNWNLVPDTLPDGTNNPIWQCGRIPNIHVCDSACVEVRTLICTEPHHRGMHYDASNPICWRACGNDEAHKAHRPVINASTGTFTSGNFLNIDYGFRIFFPNVGNFNDWQPHGIGALTSQRGLGFVDNMNTTRWTRVKRIRFEFNVIYEGVLYKSGEWITLGDKGTYTGAPGSIYNERNWSNFGTALYNNINREFYDFYAVLANYEAKSAAFTVEVEAVNCPGPNDNTFNATNRTRGMFSALHGGTNTAYVDVVGRIGNLTILDTGDLRFSNFFKTPMENITPPMRNAHTVSNGLRAFGAAIISGGRVITNGVGQGAELRNVTLNKGLYRIDIDGRSLNHGRLMVNTIPSQPGGVSEDLSSGDTTNRIVATTQRMSFHLYASNAGNVNVNWVANSSASMEINGITITYLGESREAWLVDGVIRTVDIGRQNNYLTGRFDIRGLPISSETNYINTFGALPWADNRRGTLPLSADRNNIEILKDQALSVGYPIYFDISTIGNYFWNYSGNVQVVPYYYALNIETRVITPVDVYFKSGREYKPINIHNLVHPNWDGSGVYNFIVTLDWLGESIRRNYTDIERYATDFLRVFYATGMQGVGAGVSTEGQNMEQVAPLPPRQLDAPLGDRYVMGNAQFMRVSGRARTFIGGETTYGQLMNLGGSNTIRTADTGRMYNPQGRIRDYLWWQSAQRWHLKLSLPSSAVFIPSGQEVNESTINRFNNENYLILATADIRAIGDTFALSYEHTNYNGSINIRRRNGSWTGPIAMPNNIPPLLAVFSTTRTSVYDIDITKTH